MFLIKKIYYGKLWICMLAVKCFYYQVDSTWLPNCLNVS